MTGAIPLQGLSAEEQKHVLSAYDLWYQLYGVSSDYKQQMGQGNVVSNNGSTLFRQPPSLPRSMHRQMHPKKQNQSGSGHTNKPHYNKR